MLETIMIAIILAKVKGYSPSKILKHWSIYPVIFLEVIHIVVQLFLFKGDYEILKYVGMFKTLYMSSYLFLVFKYELYTKAIIGSFFVMIGGKLNDIAIAANGGKMPVFPSLSYITGYAKETSFNLPYDIHILGNSETNLKFLTDVIDLGYSVLSIGDVLIRVFVFMIVYYAIKESNALVRNKETH